MKEFMYATALCLLMSALWCFSKIPSETRIEAARSGNPELALSLAHDRMELRYISAGALGLSIVAGLVGWRSKSRENQSRKQID